MLYLFFNKKLNTIMNTEIISASSISAELTELLLPFMSALVLLVITLWVKDFAAKIAKGVAFKLNSSFQEGDKVILDGERALIVKIGITHTVFGINKHHGEFKGDYCWRFVPNERIPYLKLEKLIFDTTPELYGEKINKNFLPHRK